MRSSTKLLIDLLKANKNLTASERQQIVEHLIRLEAETKRLRERIVELRESNDKFRRGM